MDLGATVCTPRSPNCLLCPVRAMCRAHSEGDPGRYPIKPKKIPKPVRVGHVYVLFDDDRQVLTERRPERGLLGGMLGLPTSDWTSDWMAPSFPTDASWTEMGEVRHVFTHFSLVLKVWRASAGTSSEMTAIEAASDALPSVFAKALKLAI